MEFSRLWLFKQLPKNNTFLKHIPFCSYLLLFSRFGNLKKLQTIIILSSFEDTLRFPNCTLTEMTTATEIMDFSRFWQFKQLPRSNFFEKGVSYSVIDCCLETLEIKFITWYFLILSSCSLVGSASATGVVGTTVGILLLLLLILAGSWGAGVLFTILPSFSTLRWSLGGGGGTAGFGGGAVDWIGVVAVPFSPLCSQLCTDIRYVWYNCVIRQNSHFSRALSLINKFAIQGSLGCTFILSLPL